jgi:WD40 repeat protein
LPRACSSGPTDGADRPNVFIKIPGTREGLPAIDEAIFAGVPINVTLLFSREHYVMAAEAFLRGIERRIEAGLNPDVSSVASVFISRWDAAVTGKTPESLGDRLGIAIAQRTYKAYRHLRVSPRWERVYNAGARPQRLLWASTGTKDPSARRLGLSLAERGISWAEEGEPARGVLWLARSLRHIPAYDTALEETVRRNLTAWSRSTHSLIAVLPTSGQNDAAAIRPDSEPLLPDGLAWSEDGQRLLTTTPARTILWNAATGKPVVSLQSGAEVEIAALSPSGHTIVTVSQGIAQLWDAASGRPLSPLAPQPAPGQAAKRITAGRRKVTAVAYNPQGIVLVMGRSDEQSGAGWAQVWDAGKGRAAGPVLEQTEPIQTIAFSPDGRKIATASNRLGKSNKQGPPWGYARLWDVDTGKPLGAPLLRDGAGDDLLGVHALTFSPDGSKLLTGNGNRTACIWDAVTAKPIVWGLQHRAPVSSVAFSPDGKTVLSGSDDRRAKLWDARTGRFLHVLDHNDKVLAVAFHPDGKSVATLCQYGSVRLWDVETGRSVGQPLGPRGASAFAFSPDGKMLVTGGEDGLARVWRLQAAPAPVQLRNQAPVLALAISPDGNQVLTGLGDTELGSVAARFQRADDQPNTPSPGSTLVPPGSNHLAAQLWDLATGRLLGGLPRQGDNRTRAVAFTLDGRIALVATVPEREPSPAPKPTKESSACAIQTWDLQTLRETAASLVEEPPSGHPVSALALAPDGKTFAVAFGPHAGVPGRCGVFELPKGNLLRSLPDSSLIRRLAFSSNGKKLLSISGNQVYVWDSAIGTEAGSPLVLPHDGHVITATFSADGAKIFTGTRDQTAQYWDAAMGNRLGWRPLWHPAPVLSIALSPDGTLVATGCADGRAKLWSVASALPLGPALPHDDKVTAVTFRPGGGALVTGSLDRTVRLWEVPEPMDGDIEEIEPRLAADTGMEIEDNGVVRFLDYASWLERRSHLPAPAR